MDRPPRSARPRTNPLADSRRRELFARLPGAPRRPSAEGRRSPGPSDDSRPQITDAYAVELRRRLDASPGFAALLEGERQDFLALVDGPHLAPTVHADRRWTLAELWTGVQKRVVDEIAELGAMPVERQSTTLRFVLRSPRQPVTLLAEPTGHVVLALGWRPPMSSALIHYGSWSMGADATSRRDWYWVKSPDTIMRRRFASVADVEYEFKTYLLSLDDERQIIEWMEQTFAVNERRVDGPGGGGGRRPPFIEQCASILNIAGRPYENGGLVDQGQVVARRLIEEV